MKFTLKKEQFLKIIQIVQNAISSKNSLPILTNILLEADKNTLRLTATDLEINISSTIPIKVEVSGAVIVPAKQLLDIIRELPDKKDIIVTVNKKHKVILECDKITFKIIGLPIDEFPKTLSFKDKDSIEIEQKLLKELISMTSFAISHDESNHILNGLLLVIKNKNIKSVATDGHRIAIIEKKMSQKSSTERNIIIPIKTVQELSKMLKETDKIKIVFDENRIQFLTKETSITTLLTEGEFPNYKQVIPLEIETKVKFNKNSLLSATKRASLLSNQDSLAIKLELSENKMTISKNTPYVGELKEEIDVDYKGQSVTIGFNPIYILEVLKSINLEEVNLEIVDAEKPGVIRIDNEFVYVMLPMELT